MISLTPVVLIHWKGYRPKPKHILGDGKISSKEGMRSSHTGQQTNTWHSHACTTWICRHLFSNSNAFSYIFVSQIRQNSHPSKSMFWAIEGPVLNESSEVYPADELWPGELQREVLGGPQNLDHLEKCQTAAGATFANKTRLCEAAQNDCDKSQFTENITWIRHAQLLNLCRTVGATRNIFERCIIGVLCISISNSLAAIRSPARATISPHGILPMSASFTFPPRGGFPS